jgi:hypothetical protein
MISPALTLQLHCTMVLKLLTQTVSGSGFVQAVPLSVNIEIQMQCEIYTQNKEPIGSSDLACVENCSVLFIYKGENPVQK